MILWISFLLIVSMTIFFWWSNKAVTITSYTYKSEKVPPDFDGFRIVQVSDLQSQYFGKRQRNLAQKVAAGSPDIIVFTGDLLDRNHTDYRAARTAMEKLLAIAPVYYVNGNHELALVEEGISQIYDQLSEMGVQVLLDRSIVIKRGRGKIRLSGLSEDCLCSAKEEGGQSCRKKISVKKPWLITHTIDEMLAEKEQGELEILLVHEPQFFSLYAKPGIDLILTGHAHGGQIRLPFTQGLFAPGQGVLPKLTSGLHDHQGCAMIISRGLGNSVFPLRLFNRPEIVIVEMKCQ